MKKKFSAVLALSCFGLFGFAKANPFITYDDLNFLSDDTKNRIISTKTVYGQGANEKYFQFQAQENGSIKLVEVPVLTNGVLGLTFKYNPQNVLNPILANTSNPTASFFGDYLNQTGALVENPVNNSKGQILAFMNSGTKIDELNVNFVGNVASSDIFNGNSIGGAVINAGEIDNVKGSFIANGVDLPGIAFGGGISNLFSIKNINADFVGNYVKGGAPLGGAILNLDSEMLGDNTGIPAQIDEINGNFIANSVIEEISTSQDAQAQINAGSGADFPIGGGAIANFGGEINKISGNFLANQTIGANMAGGGAINNLVGSIKEISGNFNNNNVIAPVALGGAISNYDENSYYYYNGKPKETDSSDKAIYRITGEFVENSTVSMEPDGYAMGGAIANMQSKIGEIDAKFKQNITSGVNSAAGAIANGGLIDKISGEFQNNAAYSSDIPTPLETNGGMFYGSALGGAIANSEGQIGEINADFLQNQAAASGIASGGAIINMGLIGKIKGKFENNSAKSNNDNASGGALYNNMDGIGGEKKSAAVDDARIKGIDAIQADFKNNTAQSEASNAFGGAIANENGRIDKIEGNFINNSAISNAKMMQNAQTVKAQQAIGAFGGAIYHSGDIKASWLPSDVSEVQTLGAAPNSSADNFIQEIKGDFKNNSTQAEYVSAGGAIYNDGTIYSIDGNFEENHADSKGGAAGGAIANFGAVQAINGNFKENYVVSQDDAAGGAIANADAMQIINADFEGNHVDSKDSIATGGAIANFGAVQAIQGTFKNNYAKSENGQALGGAIYSESDLNVIADNSQTLFSGNYTDNNGVIDSNAIYLGDLVNNNLPILTLSATNQGTITFDDKISGNEGYEIYLTGDETGKVVLNNYVDKANVLMENITLKLGAGDVLKDSTFQVNSGLVDVRDGKYTNYDIKEITSGTTVTRAASDVKYAVDIFLSEDEQISDTFTISDTSTGKINIGVVSVDNQCSDDKEYVLQIIKSKSSDAPELAYDSAKVLNEAKANMTDEDIIADGFALATTTTSNDSIKVRGMKDTFLEWAKFDKSEDKEFVFNNNSDYTIKHDLDLKGSNVTIKGSQNTLDINNTNLISNIEKDKNINLENIKVTNIDEINNDGNLNLKSASAEISKNVLSNQKGKITLDNSNLEAKGTLVNQEIEAVNKSSLTISNTNDFKGNDVNLNQSMLNIPHLNLQGINFDNLNLSDGVISIDKVDVDLQNETMGQISSTNSNITNGTIDIKALNALSDSNKDELQIAFLEKDAQNIAVNLENKEVLTPIRKYEAQYLKNDDKGFFKFKNLGSSNNNYNNFNPAILASSVAAQLGGYLIQLNSYDEAFRNMDMYMLLSKKDREALRQQKLQIQQLNPDNKFKNRIASIQMNANYDEQIDKFHNSAGWFRPYSTFENVPLKNGPKVNNVTYGSFFGTESKIYSLKNWDIINGLYIGYNGSHQSYGGIDIYQNGGTLGAISMAYKDNFFTGLTLNTGANAGRANTMYGYDDFTTYMAGLASKTGYNFEFKDGKYIIQPNYLMSYSFINTFDYTNAVGVKIDTNALHAIQIEPGIKFIANLKNNFQPYANVSFIWSILDKTNFRANDIALSELSIKPYVKYGIGIRKTHKDRLTGYFQTYLTHGGRNGVGLQAGLSILVGR